MTPLELLVCVILIAVAAFMSASEVALFSLSRFQIRSIKDRFKKSHTKIRKLLADPAGLLVVILVVNEIVNISLSTLITGAVSRGWGQDSPEAPVNFLFLHNIPHWAMDTILGIVFTTPVVLFICEITPKVIGARANQIVAAMTAGPLLLVYESLAPVRVFLKKFISSFSAILSSRMVDAKDYSKFVRRPILREADFLSMIEEAHKEGTIQQSELELIKNVFDLDDTVVSEIYTPFSQVYSLPAQTTLQAALNALTRVKDPKFSRIPVTESASGPGKIRVIGVLYSKDLLVAKLEKEDPSTPISALMWKPFTVSMNTKLNGLFRRMKNQKTHMAVIEDDHENAVGIVTMQDLLDVLFEELFPPENPPAPTKIAPKGVIS
ncbi:MAG: DUF21 domain-containing protein [Methylotenera sp.]|nr:DUF21 domain-containing protein [Oligoflexia bacterium]